MAKILITGATGNIGQEVIRSLLSSSSQNSIVAGVRDISRAQKNFAHFPTLQYVLFDFENSNTFAQALTGIDTVFLLRPPHISNVDLFFKPLIQATKTAGISNILFLSVQGVETSRVIPHNKIEHLIREHDFKYIFLRPSYFMQNLTTTLLPDIIAHRRICLPAGRAVFNWVDISNIGETSAVLLCNFEKYKNRAIEITGYENEPFAKVAALLTTIVGETFTYRNTNPISYFFLKKKEGVAIGLIIVMILLHFLPRFQKAPAISRFYEDLTGKKPTSLKEFIQREKHIFVSPRVKDSAP